MGLLLACAPSGQPVPAEPRALEVEYAGCKSVLAGPVCVLADNNELRLWTRVEPGTEVAFPHAGVEILSQEEVLGGRLFRLRLPAELPRLSLQAQDPTGRREWTLSLSQEVEPEWQRRARELLHSPGREAEAQALIEETLPNLPPAEQGTALRALTAIAYRAGDFEAELSHLRLAIEAHRKARRPYDEIVVATNLFYRLFFANRVAEARAVLAELPAEPAHSAEASFFRHYYSGLLAAYTGDLRAALRHLKTSAQQAERLGLLSLRHMAEQVLGWQLQRLGRGKEAAEIYARLRRELPENSTPCQRGQFLNNLAWRLLLGREAGTEGEDPLPMLHEARDLLEQQCTTLYFERANVETNLALAYLHAVSLQAATRHLETARKLNDSPDLPQRLWWRDIEANIALEAGQPHRALEVYAEVTTLADSFYLPEAEWRATIGKARALRALGRADEALDLFAQAEEILEEESLEVPIDEGRETFIARRRWATLRHLELLLEEEKTAEAAAVARRARSRVLRSLRRGDRLAHLDPRQQEAWDAAIAAYQEKRAAMDAQASESWRLPAAELRQQEQEHRRAREELRTILDQALALLDDSGRELAWQPRPPAPGELRLVYHPLGEGWVGFAEDDQGVVAQPLPYLAPSSDQEVLARQLLAPFGDRIARADRLSILTYGFLREIDFHALPFRGEALLAGRPVVYGLDLGGTKTGEASVERRALVVADPIGDLPSTQQEGKEVRAAIRSRQEAWSVELLVGEEANGTQVRALLHRSTLFHFAGHGDFRSEDGWQSALVLAGGTQLSVGDILALPNPPEQVVLSGCETGRVTLEARVDGATGLAHAFLAAGSQGVVAATRPVTDRLAASLMATFYREWVGETLPATALQRAQLALLEQDPSSDWASFRLIEP